MKILFIAHNSLLSGGANRSLLMVLKQLRLQYGVECNVVVPQKKGALIDALKSEKFDISLLFLIMGLSLDFITMEGIGCAVLRFGLAEFWNV